MKLTLKAIATVSLITLASCSGGGGGGGPVTPINPDNGGGDNSGPASNNPNDLISWAMDGGTPVYNQYIDNNDMTRIERSAMVDGKSVSVTVDEMPNGDYGLIQYNDGSGVNFYTLDDDLVASTDMPAGQYLGSFDVDYTTNGGANWTVGQGDMSMTLDVVNGTVAFGGMSSGDNSSVEYYGDATLQNGQFVTDAGSVIFREDGAVVGTDDAGNVNGIFIGSGNEAGAVGLVNSDSGNLKSNGGFSTTHRP